MKRFLQGFSSSASPYVGKTYRFGRLECIVEDQIAEGGFSLVFVVRASNGSHYALKRISVNNRKDLQVGKLEISIMKKLSCHKNIITYVDSSITEVNPGIFELLILMEYCRDGHVIQLMNENLNSGLSEEMILRIFTDVCEAVATLHHSQPPVVHRDLKVENILRNSKGDFVLCDYGSASTTPIDPKESKLSEVEEEIQRFTTLSYRAPEMVDLYSEKVIYTKSDIWALGCLLYKLCFFTVPFGESVLAIQNGQFTIPESSRYSKELHSLIRYILEPDPDNRPDIYQVSSVAFQLRKMTCPVLNPSSSSVPKQLPDDNSKSATSGKSKAARSVHEPVSTSFKPRDRPRAGGVPPANNTPAAPSTVESSTLLQQAQAYRYDVPPQQAVQSHPQVAHQPDRPPGNNPGYLNPFGERPSRDPSPVGKRTVVDRVFTHTRSRSDPIFVRNHANMMANQGGSQNVTQHAPRQQNVAHITQQQQMNSPQTTYRQEIEPPLNFPKWNPFSNDFVLNTTTTDDDFASLRQPTVQHGQQRQVEPTVQHGQQSPARIVKPAVQHGQQRQVEPTVQHGQRNTGQAYAPQFVSGNMQAHYAQQPSNSSLSTQRSSNNSNVSPYASDSSRRSSDCEDDVIIARPIVRPNTDDFFGGSRKNDAFLDASVNAGCEIDEMTTSFNRNTTLHEPSRTQSGHNDFAGVFDSAPFRKSAKATPVVTTTPAPPVSPGRDPFGAVPFKQKEAAKLARRQARKNKESSNAEARRVLPTIPSQARR